MVTKRDAPPGALADGELAPSYRRRRADGSIEANVALTYVSGELQRAPRWMMSPDGESYLAPTAWSGWAASSSNRVAFWKRYVIGNSLFLWRVLKQIVLSLSLVVSLSN